MTIQDIYCYSSQAETMIAGIYNSANSLMKSVTLISGHAGWYDAAFPITLTPATYYLGRYGTGERTQLVRNAGVGSFYGKFENLPNSFTQTGSYGSLGTPIYITGCVPLTIVGDLYGIGDSITEGTGASGESTRFLTLFTSWLNANYGPVTYYNQGISGLNSDNESTYIVTQLSGKNLVMCNLEIGSNDFEYRGGPGSSNCGDISLSAAVTSSQIYETQLREIISEIKKHLAPGGVLTIMNFFQADGFIYFRFPDWKDYHAVLKLYNDVIAKVASENGAKLIDLYSLIAANPSFVGPTECHPNDAGQAAIAELLKRAIETAPSLKNSPK